MGDLVKKIYNNRVIRYLFFGVCTTLVNLGVFYILRKCKIELMIANCISIIVAIIFAYIVNAFFVFDQRPENLRKHILMFGKFISARFITMAIEIGGVWLAVDILYMNDMVGKLITQFIIVVLNYVFSRFFVFCSKNEE